MPKCRIILVPLQYHFTANPHPGRSGMLSWVLCRYDVPTRIQAYDAQYPTQRIEKVYLSGRIDFFPILQHILARKDILFWPVPCILTSSSLLDKALQIWMYILI